MTASATEGRHARSGGLHSRAAGEVLSDLLDAQIAALGSLRAVTSDLERVAAAVATALAGGGRAGFAGAGSSGLMALADCLELAGTFGLPPDRTPILFAGGAEALLHMVGSVEDDPALPLADLDRSGLGRGDVLLVLSASGKTPYALMLAREARARGILVAGFANVPGSDLLDLADIAVLLETGPELIAGSTRMGAATAQKVALNMISVLVGIRLGHVHDGYMVNLVADNAKLIDRAARIVAAIAEVSREEAEGALAQTDGAVKAAILVARGRTPGAAKEQLKTSGGHLAALLAQDQNQQGD